MKYKQFHILKEEAKATIASLYNEYVKALDPEKGGEDSGTFKVIATSDDVDRDGEIIDVNGWDFTNYEKNPVVLWGHDFYSMPIGKVTKLTREGNKIVAEGIFAPTERGQDARKAYDGEFLNTVSVGFIPRERKGNTITKSELLELSFVPVPANANAVAIRAIEELATKMVGEKAPEAVEDKGIVADVADAMGSQDGAVYNQKWGNLSQVNQIVGALYEVYTRPEVGVDDFDGLLKESIDLLNGLLGSRVQTEGVVAQNMKSVDKKSLTDAIADNFAQKSGRVLSKKNRGLIESAAKALQDLLDGADTSDEEKALEPVEPIKPVETSTAQGEGESKNIADITAAVLRGIDKAVGKELRDLKLGK